jgi:glycosyltransferase involved in cell wall biosynthesis
LSAVWLHVRLPSAVFPPYPEIRVVAPLYHRVAAAVRDFRPDLIHCQTEFLVGRMGQIAARRYGVPLVSSYHTDFSRYTDAYGVPLLRPVLNSYIARFHQRSQRVFTPSDPAKGDLARMGVDNVEVWGRGVDTKQFNPKMWSRALRDQLGISDEIMFLHVGRLAAEKNVELILEAYEIFRARNNDLRSVLVVAGDGPAAENLRQRAGTGVTFLGNLERKLVLPLLYASADAFVYSSETETLGLVVLEAMASGVPVVATPAGGVADNLRHEQNGLAFPAGDAQAMSEAMERVARDQSLRQRLSLGARAWAKARGWDEELDRLDASYKELIADSNGRRTTHPIPDRDTMIA